MRAVIVLGFSLTILALVFFLLRFTQGASISSPYTVKAFFIDAGGVKEGAPVTLMGVTIGSVSEIELNRERRGVVMELDIDGSAKIPEDSKLKITEKGMLGEMYLAFSYGQSKKNLKEGSEIEGDRPFNLTEFMSSMGGKFEKIGDQVSELAVSFNDPELKKGLIESLKEMPQLIRSSREMIEENRKSIQKIMVRLEEGSAHLNDSLAILKKEAATLEEGQLADHLVQTAANTSVMTKKIKNKIEGLMENSSEALSYFNSTAAQTNDLIEKLNALISDLNQAKGTAGKLMKDDTLYFNLNDMVVAARDLLETLNEQPSSILWGKRGKKKKSSSNEDEDE